MKYINLHTAYCDQLKKIYYEPQFKNAPRGFQSYEQLNQNFTLIFPEQRICYLPSRKTNIIFNFIEVFWYLAADRKLDFIANYADQIRQYSMDGLHLTGTAYGPKIFSYGHSLINQWNRVINILQNEDSHSKRAYIQIFDPEEDLSLRNIDVSCTLGMQFFVRNKKLYMTVYMRANDAYRGILSDIFSFTFLQELMARQLNLELGDYHHNVGSSHIYQKDEARVKKVLAELENQPHMRRAPYTFPTMPQGNNWEHISILLEEEKKIRVKRKVLTFAQIEALNLPHYWQQILILFNMHAMIKNNEIDIVCWNHLLPIYQFLLYNKWPKSFRLQLHKEKFYVRNSVGDCSNCT